MKLLITSIFSLSAILFISLSNNKNLYFDVSKSHHTKSGFTNPYINLDNQNKSFSDLFRMMQTDRLIPINRDINDGKNFVTWIGHSTMLLNINGKTILTDPIFSERCSPVQFVGPKRYTKPSINLESLPDVDFVLISHNHYDHLDKNTIKYLKKDTTTTWFVPLGLASWLEKEHVKNIIELDLHDKYLLGNVEVVCTPSQHWSK